MRKHKMRINGYWLGSGLIMLLDYIHFLFIADNKAFFSLNCGVTMICLVIFFGLAFKQKDVIK